MIRHPESRKEWRLLFSNVLSTAAWIEKTSNSAVRADDIYADILPTHEASLPERLRGLYSDKRSISNLVTNGLVPKKHVVRPHVPELLAIGVYRFGLRAGVWTEDEYGIEPGSILLMLCNGFESAPLKIKHALVQWDEGFDHSFPAQEVQRNLSKPGIGSWKKDDSVLTYESQDAWYDAVADAIEQLRPVSTLRHAHIQDDPPSPDEFSDSIKRFIEVFERTIEESRTDGIEVRQFYSVTSLRRAEQLVKRVSKYSGARGYQVKFWPANAVFPTLSPIIVGEHDAFIAIDDPATPHVQRGIHIQGATPIKNLIRFFDSFFAERNPGNLPWFCVRNERGINRGEIEAFKGQLEILGISINK